MSTLCVAFCSVNADQTPRFAPHDRLGWTEDQTLCSGLICNVNVFLTSFNSNRYCTAHGMCRYGFTRNKPQLPFWWLRAYILIWMRRGSETTCFDIEHRVTSLIRNVNVLNCFSKFPIQQIYFQLCNRKQNMINYSFYYFIIVNLYAILYWSIIRISVLVAQKFQNFVWKLLL